MAKLKTYVAPSGFYELAVAAPSMKAALRAWGMTHNAFAHGGAAATTDPAIVAAATAQPGVVLKRPIGSKGAFLEHPVAVQAPKPPKGFKKRSLPKTDNVALRKAQAALKREEADHEAHMKKLAAMRTRLETEEATESARWKAAREKLHKAVERARGH
jgi:hypothetical protein